MKTLNIDIETYSDIDLFKDGVYKYVDSPNFEILLFAYSIDGGSEKCVDLASGEKIPTEILNAIKSPHVLKIAFNAQFERVCLSKYLCENAYIFEVPASWVSEEMLDPSQWNCTMVHANELGLPSSLAQCALYLGIDEQKDSKGKALINYFSKPCKPTKANEGRTRNLPEHDLEKWYEFIDYCIQDVKTEKAIASRLSIFPVKDSEWELYSLDQRINDRGVGLDEDLVESALTVVDEKSATLMAEMKKVTGLDNPNSLKQLKEWLAEQGYQMDKLGKDLIIKALADGEIAGPAKRALELRLQSSMSSTKKYQTMQRATCSDDRVHGLLQFYGASRTGRWAGRLVQVQNLPRNYLSDLDTAREFIKTKDVEMIEYVYDSLPDTLKQLIRTAFIAKKNYTLHVSDFSAIEARVIAWFAGEAWRLDVFSTHGKIYEASASAMFNVPIEEVDSELRQKGKVSELALGYQGGPGALVAMGALDMGLEEHELQPLVDAWRKSNKKIVKFWYDVQRAAQEAIREKKIVRLQKGLAFIYKKGFLFIQLPSGRRLAYAKAKLAEGKKFGNTVIQYDGKGEKVAFTTLETYGGKLVENIVQATARDILAEAMMRLNKEEYEIVFHVHDEVVAEVEEGSRSIAEMNEIMSKPISWAEGLPLGADGYETKYYKKD